MNLLERLQPIRDNMDDLSFGEILRCTRDFLGMKQWKLAELLNISPQTLKNYEINHYRSHPSDEMLLKLGELFEYPVFQMNQIITRHVNDYRSYIGDTRKSQ